MEAKAIPVSTVPPIIGCNGNQPHSCKVFGNYERTTYVPWNAPTRSDNFNILPKQNTEIKQVTNPQSVYHTRPKNDYLASRARLLTEAFGHIPNKEPVVFISVQSNTQQNTNQTQPAGLQLTIDHENMVFAELAKLQWCHKDEGKTKTIEDVKKLPVATIKKIFPYMVEMSKKLGKVMNGTGYGAFSGVSPNEEANVLFHTLALGLDMYKGALEEPSFALVSMDQYYKLFDWMCNVGSFNVKDYAGEIALATNNTA